MLQQVVILCLAVSLVGGTIPDFNLKSREDSFAEGQLTKTNAYRTTHSADSLAMDSELTESAQTFATYLAQNDKFEHAPSGDREGQGENIYKACSSGDSPSGDAATDEWYAEEANYDYATGSSHNGGVIGHFTQIVWNRTNGKFGIAKATGTSVINGATWNCVWVVGRYSPPGNFIGQYTDNINSPNDDGSDDSEDGSDGSEDGSDDSGDGSDGSDGTDDGSDGSDGTDECAAKTQELCAIADCQKPNAATLCPDACPDEGDEGDEGCVDIKPEEKCEKRKAKGKCEKKWAKKNCKATCGHCE